MAECCCCGCVLRWLPRWCCFLRERVQLRTCSTVSRYKLCHCMRAVLRCCPTRCCLKDRSQQAQRTSTPLMMNTPAAWCRAAEHGTTRHAARESRSSAARARTVNVLVPDHTTTLTAYYKYPTARHTGVWCCSFTLPLLQGMPLLSTAQGFSQSNCTCHPALLQALCRVWGAPQKCTLHMPCVSPPPPQLNSP